jgi:flagellar hook-associated protein 3 FlgL
MRISTGQMYGQGLFGIQRGQSQAYYLQNQISTNRRVVTPADDPVAAAQALVVEQKQYVNDQYMKNQGMASDNLSELESLMTSVIDQITATKGRWVEAGNGGYDSEQMKAIAYDVQNTFEQIFSTANNANANGLYRFSGYQSSTQPFVKNGDQITYQGDSGTRELQVEASRFIGISFSGQEFFQNIPNGDGTVAVNAGYPNSSGHSNTGTGVIQNSVDSTNYDKKQYEIEFTNTSADPMQYTLHNRTDGTDSTGTFKPGDTIDVGGAKVQITGSPADGDKFTVEPSTTEGIFDTLQKFVNTLNTVDPGSAEYQNAYLRVGQQLDNTLNHMSDNRAVVGARMNELEQHNNLGKNLDLQYKTQHSNLVDLDLDKALSDSMQVQLQLQAAMQSYTQLTGLTIFNYL